MWLKVTIDVQKASAKNAYCVYGHPSPFTFIGFVHALCARAELEQQGGVLMVIHDISLHANTSKFREVTFDMPRSAQRDSRASPSAKGKSQLDMPMADLSVSMCFQFDTDTYDGLDARIKETLNGMRFGGGVLSHTFFKIFDTADQAFRTRAGFVMCGAVIDKSEKNIFNRMLDKVSVQKGKRGWYSPSLVGFRMIEDPQENRAGSRGAHPHAYADPVIGVVEFKSVRKATIDDMWTTNRQDKLIKFTTKNLEILELEQSENQTEINVIGA